MASSPLARASHKTENPECHDSCTTVCMATSINIIYDKHFTTTATVTTTLDNIDDVRNCVTSRSKIFLVYNMASSIGNVIFS
jgi:hypothetical protein